MRHATDRVRHATPAPPPAVGPLAGPRRAPGPVMLATLQGAGLHPDAARLAVAVAAESGRRLIVVHVVDHPPSAPPGRRYDPGPAPAVAASLQAPVDLAIAAGAAVTHGRVRSLRPLATLVDLVTEHDPDLVVFGADPDGLSWLRAVSRRRHRHAVHVLRRRTSCLLWQPGDGRPGAPP
ncbi:MAG: hypothetical protein QOD81_755 [Solirubrobacteraceae bacterium]|nr:hypothetical protein [Solirubrobacteraceae bacterium]